MLVIALFRAFAIAAATALASNCQTFGGNRMLAFLHWVLPPGQTGIPLMYLVCS